MSRDKKWLWWPPSLQVKSKAHCDPDVTTWKTFKVLKIKIRGMQTHLVKAWCADGLNPPSIDNPSIYCQPPFYLFSKLLTFDIFWRYRFNETKKMNLRKFQWNSREKVISSRLQNIIALHVFFFCKRDFDKQH